MLKKGTWGLNLLNNNAIELSSMTGHYTKYGQKEYAKFCSVFPLTFLLKRFEKSEKISHEIFELEDCFFLL